MSKMQSIELLLSRLSLLVRGIGALVGAYYRFVHEATMATISGSVAFSVSIPRA
jgi:hypothetical protein